MSNEKKNPWGWTDEQISDFEKNHNGICDSCMNEFRGDELDWDIYEGVGRLLCAKCKDGFKLRKIKKSKYEEVNKGW